MIIELWLLSLDVFRLTYAIKEYSRKRGTCNTQIHVVRFTSPIFFHKTSNPNRKYDMTRPTKHLLSNGHLMGLPNLNCCCFLSLFWDNAVNNLWNIYFSQYIFKDFYEWMDGQCLRDCCNKKFSLDLWKLRWSSLEDLIKVSKNDLNAMNILLTSKHV